MPRWMAISALVLLSAAHPAAADYGRGVAAWARADYGAAAREFTASAEAGDSESQYMLGRLYALGLGVPRDFVRAWQWLDLAARQGNAEARMERDDMAAILTPAQLAEARGTAAPADQQTAEAPPPQGGTVLLVPRTGEVRSVP
ncbi:MAG: tetratricopeptide repeat protein [Actinomycetota bacterium]